MLLIPGSTGLQAFDVRLCDHKYHWVTVSRGVTVKGESKREGKFQAEGRLGKVRAGLFSQLTLLTMKSFQF